MKIIKQTKNKDDLWYFKPDQPWHKPGRMFKLTISDFFDNKVQVSVPAVILNTKMHTMQPPTHDVGFWTLWNSMEKSGMLTIVDMYPSRYEFEGFTDIDDNFLSHFKDLEIPEYNIGPNNLFFIKEISDTERHLCYPFREEDVN